MDWNLRPSHHQTWFEAQIKNKWTLIQDVERLLYLSCVGPNHRSAVPLSPPLHRPLPYFSFSKLFISSQSFNVTHIKDFSGLMNVLLALTHLFFFWRVNTKRKWGKSWYLRLPVDSISISVSPHGDPPHLHSSLNASSLSFSLFLFPSPYLALLETSSWFIKVMYE